MRSSVFGAVASATLSFAIGTWFMAPRSVVAHAERRLAGLASAQQGTMEVKIDNFSFGPTTLTVAAGSTVTWVNHDDIPHTVVSTDGAFKSKVLDTDEQFSFTFTKPGTYAYFCSIHPKMTGTLVVQ
ncbi:MAG TPA: cupredoxin family copper-binding protein [Candidatus Acidoferrum sp.]